MATAKAGMTSTKGWSSLSSLGQAGLITQGFGAIQGAIGSYYAASAAKYKTQSMALSFEHQKNMALFNMDMKESQAQHLNRVYNQRQQIKTLGFGQSTGKRNVSIAARGGVRGVGSNLNIAVSDELMKEIDKITMNSNKVRAIANKRLEGVGLGIQADMHGLSASNAFATASQISPWMDMSSSLMTGASGIISSLPESMLLA